MGKGEGERLEGVEDFALLIYRQQSSGNSKGGGPEQEGEGDQNLSCSSIKEG